MANKRVMIVDDDKELLDELGEALALSGYDMVPVEGGSSALEMVSKVNPDVILLDLKMPGKSGFQLADEIRHVPEFSRIPIIAMTGFFKEGFGPLMEMCGIKKYLKKPFNPLNMIFEIESVLK